MTMSGMIKIGERSNSIQKTEYDKTFRLPIGMKMKMNMSMTMRTLFQAIYRYVAMSIRGGVRNREKL